MTLNNTEKNYAPAWKKLSVAGAVAATMAGLMIAQNLTQVSASESSEYIAVTEFAAGNTHATVLSEEGKAYSRGWNNQGQLGVATGAKVDVSEWTEISTPEKLTNIETSDHTVALGESGKLYTWGPNANGQVGNGNTAPAFNLSQITAVDRFSKVASGDAFTLALDAGGRLWSWGANNAGQLGDGTNNDRSTPNMVGGDTSFKEVYAAKESAYAITEDGQLWAWGANTEGQLGDGTTNNRKEASVVATGQRWSQLAVSLQSNTVLGLDNDGMLYSWGSNKSGLLGNGTDWRKLQEEENARFKAMIEEIERKDAERRAGLVEQCLDEKYATAYEEYEEEYEKVSKEREEAEEAARKKKEKEEEKKKKEEEQEQDEDSPKPSTSASPTPSASPSETATEKPLPNPDDLKEPVRAEFADECEIEVDKTFAKTDTSGMKPAIIKEPALKEGRTAPAQVETEQIVTDIAVGSENAFMVDGLNRLHSWGKDANGQTGLGLEDQKSHTQVPVLVWDEVSIVSAGDRFAAAVGTNGELLLWGTNTNGVLLSKPQEEQKLLKPTEKGSGYTNVIAGVTTVYGFKKDSAYAWGNNANGELGTGSGDGAVFSAFPIDRKMKTIAPAGKGAVALGTGNELLYWGMNNSGQFGNNETASDSQRTVSSNEISTFTGIASGENYSTAVSSDGRLWGWGSNASRLLNLSVDEKDRLVPAVVSTGLDKVTAVAGGKNISAFTDGATLLVWTGGESHSYDLADVVEIAAGDNHIVARAGNGEAWNWTADGSGVRAGTAPQTLVKVDDLTYESVVAGGIMSGGVTAEGESIIWGEGTEKLRLAEEEGAPIKNFKFNRLSMADGYVLASDENGVLWGWGENHYLVLGAQSVHEFPIVLTAQADENDEEKEGK